MAADYRINVEKQMHRFGAAIASAFLLRFFQSEFSDDCCGHKVTPSISMPARAISFAGFRRHSQALKDSRKDLRCESSENSCNIQNYLV